MKKKVVTLMVAVLTLTSATTAFAANQSQQVSIAYEGDGNTQISTTGSVTGQHKYGRWTVQHVEGTTGAEGVLQENCDGSWEDVDYLTVPFFDSDKSASSDYYMAGACSYRVKLYAMDGDGAKAYVRNYK
ncbi:hypothetical protein [Paenibacillus turpanensis]|uniref:hypothetical protein n=1 Tax=Paenibacillus turpanensis TaxID=2689078 RepID=UPI0014077C45|nr:hypothetical protein [Paenibacillus turpanensis]